MKLKAVVLQGFKGIKKCYELHRPLVLFGENGSGKSAVLQAVHYALSGEVPTGKALDAVASFFPPHGGWVILELESGEWLQRGITLDAEKKKNSELLKIEGDPAHFQFNPAVLNIKNFLTLSASARRDFLMELISTKATGVDLLKGVTGEFARGLGGEAATPEWLKIAESPEGRFFYAKSGVLDNLKSLRVEGMTLGAICNLYLDTAKEAKLAARRAATEAKAAIRELEPEAQMKKNIASALPAARERVIQIQRESEGHLAKQKLLGERIAALEAAQERHFEMKGRLTSILNQAPRLPEETHNNPPLVGGVGGLEAGNLEITSLRSKVGELETYLEDLARLETQEKTLSDALRKEAGHFEVLCKEPANRLVVLLSEVPDAAHPNIKPLKALADQTMVGILARIDASKKEILHLNGMINEVQDEIANKFPINSADVRGRLDEFRDQLLMTEEVYADQFRLASEALATAKEAQRTKDAGVQAQRVWERAHAEAVAKCNIASQTLEKAEEEYTAIVNELEASSDNPHEAEARLKAATFALDEAQKAVGVVAAYERAIESARAATVEELAWKLAEAAIKAVRERFVG